MFAATACVVAPDPLTEQEIAEELTYNQRLIQSMQELPDGPLTLAEAISYGIVFNLDNRIRLAEEAIAQDQLNFSRWSMYPRITASAGYSDRNNDFGSFSQSLLTGRESLELSTSQERERTESELQVAWNILDFGVSYFSARQQANQVLILQERQRRVLQQLAHDIKDAYWQLVALQNLSNALAPLAQRLEDAIAQAEAIERERLQDPAQTLTYLQNLYNKLSQIESLRESMIAARARLNQLLNLPPTFNTAVVAQEVDSSFSVEPVDVLEEFALINRPELIEATYQKRISADEIKKSIARMYPGLEFSVGYNQNSNRFLANEEWVGSGIRVTWNLMNLLSGSDSVDMERARAGLQELRNLALNMSVLAQVNIAYVNYEQAQRQVDLTNRLAEISADLQNLQSDAFLTDSASELDLIQADLDLLLANLRKDESQARLQSAYSQLKLTTGEYSFQELPQTDDISVLADYLQSLGI